MLRKNGDCYIISLMARLVQLKLRRMWHFPDLIVSIRMGTADIICIFSALSAIDFQLQLGLFSVTNMETGTFLDTKKNAFFF